MALGGGGGAFAGGSCAGAFDGGGCAFAAAGLPAAAALGGAFTGLAAAAALGGAFAGLAAAAALGGAFARLPAAACDSGASSPACVDGGSVDLVGVLLPLGLGEGAGEAPFALGDLLSSFDFLAFGSEMAGSEAFLRPAFDFFVLGLVAFSALVGDTVGCPAFGSAGVCVIKS